MLIGNPFRFDSLGNVGIKSASTSPPPYEYRFQASGGDVEGIRLFLVFRPPASPTGYFNGNGGHLKVDLCEDDGTVLDTFTDTTPMVGGTNGVRWPLYAFTATLVPGDFYRIKFSNPAGSPGSNWISIDDAYLGATQPGWAELGISALQNGDVNTNHTPCFEVVYEDGHTDGVCYIDIPSGYNADDSATLVFTPDADYDVTDIFVGLDNDVTPSGNLTATLREGASVLWTDTTPAAVGWCRFSGVGVTVVDGTEYTLTVTGNFRIRAMQKGTSRGFDEPSLGGVFSDSRSSGITLPIYMAVDEGSGSPGEPPLNVTLPTVSGQAVVGETLTGTTGTWNGAGITFTRRWMRCNAAGGSCSAIGGATASTYVLDPADVGSTIREEVTGTNADGSNVATSNQTGVVGGASGSGTGDPVNVEEPTTQGTYVRAQTLNAGPGEWDGDTPMTFSYQWRRADNDAGLNAQDIPGATGVEYTLQPQDVGKSIGVRVGATN